MNNRRPDTPLYLALDQGGHASRALVFDREGRCLAMAQRPLRTIRAGNRVEHDGDELVAGLRAAAADALAQLGERQTRLVAAALATQRSNIVCWHRASGAPLSPVLSWQDRRAAERLAGLDPEWVKGRTGLFPSAHYGASKIAWCLEGLPAVRRAQREGELVVGPMASFLASRLTGAAPLADPVNASRTLLWQLDGHDWDGALCRHFGIEPALLPPCVGTDHGFGSLRLEGLELPLEIVTGDLAAAAFANGPPSPEQAAITLGTGAFVQLPVGEPVGHPRLLDGVLWHSGEGTCLSLEGTVNGAGGAIEWLAVRHRVGIAAIERNLDVWLAAVEEPPLFLNAVSGIGSPLWCGDSQPCFDREEGLAEEAVAVVESILFLLLLNLCEMQCEGQEVAGLTLNGGLSRVDGLCQRMADLAGVTVVRQEEAEGTARGLAALLCDCGDRWPRRETRFEPRDNRALHGRFERWQRFVQQGLSPHCHYYGCCQGGAE